MLSIDYTLVIQIVNFLVLLFVLNIFLYKPIRGILAKRHEEEAFLNESIDSFNGQSDQNEKGIEEGSIQARKEGVSEKAGIKGQGQEKEHGILQDAYATAEEKIGDAKKEIENRMNDVRKSLEDQVALFSNELAEKILGRRIQ